ncbi:metallophosphoesterase [Microbaculum marinum]|uniref:Metallophosphoesterase n=1 Tax=Microbaculum marinum TaxID=1764581 RepID=A0AAW9RPA9_9HYPH
MRVTRRGFLTGVAATAASGVSLGGYAFAIEPRFRLVVARHAVESPAWPRRYPALRIAVLSDLHACDPWMPVGRIDEIVDRALKLEPDVVVVLGDFAAGLRRFRTREVEPEDWAKPLSRLSAPLGVHAVLGNHDWWTDVDAVRFGLKRAGIPVYENDAMRLNHRGRKFWIAGLGDQIAMQNNQGGFRGVDDLPGTLEAAGDGFPVVLMAHEPDIFVDVPGEQVAVTLAGHTHGGQIRLPGLGRPVIPSQYGDRFAYGHIVENDRHLVVSAGLGCSILPVRFGVPPEITLVTLRSRSA